MSDKAVYVVRDERGLLIIHLHVDDTLVFCDNATFFQDFKSFIHSAYELKWTDFPTLYLDIKININTSAFSIKLSQPQYIKAILDLFEMINCKSAGSPLPSKTVFETGTKDEIKSAQDLPFQQLVGCLQWASHTTRPEIAYAVTQISPLPGLSSIGLLQNTF